MIRSNLDSIIINHNIVHGAWLGGSIKMKFHLIILVGVECYLVGVECYLVWVSCVLFDHAAFLWFSEAYWIITYC